MLTSSSTNDDACAWITWYTVEDPRDTEIEMLKEKLATAIAGAEFWYKKCLEACVIAIDIAPGGGWRNLDLPIIDDGFGNKRLAWCPECGNFISFVRPGYSKCQWCENRATY